MCLALSFGVAPIGLETKGGKQQVENSTFLISSVLTARKRLVCLGGRLTVY